MRRSEITLGSRDHTLVSRRSRQKMFFFVGDPDIASGTGAGETLNVCVENWKLSDGQKIYAKCDSD